VSNVDGPGTEVVRHTLRREFYDAGVIALATEETFITLDGNSRNHTQVTVEEVYLAGVIQTKEIQTWVHQQGAVPAVDGPGLVLVRQTLRREFYDAGIIALATEDININPDGDPADWTYVSVEEVYEAGVIQTKVIRTTVYQNIVIVLDTIVTEYYEDGVLVNVTEENLLPDPVLV